MLPFPKLKPKPIGANRDANMYAAIDYNKRLSHADSTKMDAYRPSHFGANARYKRMSRAERRKLGGGEVP
jgi:hypothetical protein